MSFSDRPDMFRQQLITWLDKAFAGLIFLFDVPLRYIWLEITSLLLLIIVFITATGNFMPTDKGNNTATPLAGDTFLLDASKIETNLKVLTPNSTVQVILTGDSSHPAQIYDAQLNTIQGLGVPGTPPYNKDVVKVSVNIPGGINAETATEFANQLANTNAIFILPPPPTTSTTTPNPLMPAQTFVLSTDKIQTDLNNLTALFTNGENSVPVAVLLIVNQQAHLYYAEVKSKPQQTETPIPLPDKSVSITITLNNATDDTIIDFATQLANASNIYLFPLGT